MNDRIMEQFYRLIAEVRQEAYEDGWNAALARLTALAQAAPPPPPVPAQQRRSKNVAPLSAGARGQIIQIVTDLVSSAPGMRGNAIVDAVMAGNPGRDRKSIDRTTRTALRRLKKRGVVESRNGLWYPAKEAA